MPHDVVTEYTGEAAAEARQVGQGGCTKASPVRLDEGERIAVEGLLDTGVVEHFDATAAGAKAHLRRQADERIAAETLAADHRLEQERIARVGELQIQRQR